MLAVWLFEVSAASDCHTGSTAESPALPNIGLSWLQVDRALGCAGETP